MDDRTLKVLELVGRNMRAERVRSGLTQEELAHMVDTSTTQIARMERGETDTGISKYVFAMEAIGASPEALFVGFAQ
ncbi:MAG: helix-turn-helix transcriptional regulator [Actinomycetales bacterium]|nr:helix-turn-helix transcriptional regulator [Actinomycetales bacterium]